jgi:hypothetical protein
MTLCGGDDSRPALAIHLPDALIERSAEYHCPVHFKQVGIGQRRRPDAVLISARRSIIGMAGFCRRRLFAEHMVAIIGTDKTYLRPRTQYSQFRCPRKRDLSNVPDR